MIVVESQSNLVDTAVGPVTLTKRTVTDFDIEDYVHLAVRAQALKLQLKTVAQAVDGRFTSNRTPVRVDDISVGGF